MLFLFLFFVFCRFFCVDALSVCSEVNLSWLDLQQSSFDDNDDESFHIQRSVFPFFSSFVRFSMSFTVSLLYCICIEIELTHCIRFFMMKRLKWPPVNVILSVSKTSAHAWEQSQQTSSWKPLTLSLDKWCIARAQENSKRWKIITFFQCI